MTKSRQSPKIDKLAGGMAKSLQATLRNRNSSQLSSGVMINNLDNNLDEEDNLDIDSVRVLTKHGEGRILSATNDIR